MSYVCLLQHKTWHSVLQTQTCDEVDDQDANDCEAHRRALRSAQRGISTKLIHRREGDEKVGRTACGPWPARLVSGGDGPIRGWTISSLVVLRSCQRFHSKLNAARQIVHGSKGTDQDVIAIKVLSKLWSTLPAWMNLEAIVAIVVLFIVRPEARPASPAITSIPPIVEQSKNRWSNHQADVGPSRKASSNG